jgi:hypothetical protein
MAASKSATRAIRIGASLAAATVKRRKAARRSRAQALRKATDATRLEITATGGKALAAGPIEAATAGVLIAEGDSWFDYPFFDVLEMLESDGWKIESGAHKGDNLEDMAYSGGQLDDFTRCIEKILRRGVEPRAILLSGGGNDIAGDEFAILLNHAASGSKGLSAKVVDGIVDERLAAAYTTILAAVTEVCKATIGRPIRTIIHGYDYPIPDGRGVLGGFGPLPGPWLEPGLRRKGYHPVPEGTPMLVTLIDRFNAMLRRVAATGGFGHVRYLDLRKTLAGGGSYKDWWANELHPTKKGFRAIAAKFAALV